MKNTLNTFLEKIGIVNYKYSLLKEDDKFNIFEILRKRGDEVNLHSRFIAELIDPLGSHNLGDTFLSLFLENLFGKKSSYDKSNANVTVEKYIGKISEDEEHGGFIDILIENIGEKPIVVENKVFAGDQPKQLLRYHNAYPNAHIVYLTLFGTEPSEQTLGGINPEDVLKLSYREFISNWLAQCIEKASKKPSLREAIIQYQNLVNDLTNNSTSMEERLEIINVIGENDNVFSAKKIADNWIHLRWHTEWDFWNDLLRLIIQDDNYKVLEKHQFSDDNLNSAIHNKMNRNYYYGITVCIGKYNGEELGLMLVRSQGSMYFRANSDNHSESLLKETSGIWDEGLQYEGKQIPGRFLTPNINFNAFNEENTLRLSNPNYRKVAVGNCWIQMKKLIEEIRTVIDIE